MAAVVVVCQNYGFGSGSFNAEVAKNISNFLPIDDGIASRYDYPIRIPVAGVVYSFETWIRCRCDSAPTNFCENFKVWYDSGLPANGFTITANSTPVVAYSQPVNTQSAQGTRVDFKDYNAEVNSLSLSGELVDVGDYTSWIVFQLEVDSTAQLGAQSVDYTIQYDEA